MPRRVSKNLNKNKTMHETVTCYNVTCNVKRKWSDVMVDDDMRVETVGCDHEDRDNPFRCTKYDVAHEHLKQCYLQEDKDSSVTAYKYYVENLPTQVRNIVHTYMCYVYKIHTIGCRLCLIDILKQVSERSSER